MARLPVPYHPVRQSRGAAAPARAAVPAPVPAPVVTSAPVTVSPERVRCAAILNHPEAVGRDALARQLALETDLPAAEAVARLAAATRGPSPVVASGAAGAAVARQALGLAPDPAADLAMAHGVAASLAGPVSPDAAAAARWRAEMEEGARTARELLGR